MFWLLVVAHIGLSDATVVRRYATVEACEAASLPMQKRRVSRAWCTPEFTGWEARTAAR